MTSINPNSLCGEAFHLVGRVVHSAKPENTLVHLKKDMYTTSRRLRDLQSHLLEAYERLNSPRSSSDEAKIRLRAYIKRIQSEFDGLKEKIEATRVALNALSTRGFFAASRLTEKSAVTQMRTPLEMINALKGQLKSGQVGRKDFQIALDQLGKARTSIVNRLSSQQASQLQPTQILTLQNNLAKVEAEIVAYRHMLGKS